MGAEIPPPGGTDDAGGRLTSTKFLFRTSHFADSLSSPSEGAATRHAGKKPLLGAKESHHEPFQKFNLLLGRASRRRLRQRRPQESR